MGRKKDPIRLLMDIIGLCNVPGPDGLHYTVLKVAGTFICPGRQCFLRPSELPGDLFEDIIQFSLPVGPVIILTIPRI